MAIPLKLCHSQNKTGVDPFCGFSVESLQAPHRFYEMSSDLFFSQLSTEARWDLGFIDGLHTAEQVIRDIANAYRHLNLGGSLLVDDVWPTDFPSSLGDKEATEVMKRKHGISHGMWFGDVFKAIISLQELIPDMPVHIVGNPSNHGQAIIVKREHSPLSIDSNLVKECIEKAGTITYESTFGEGTPWIEDDIQSVFLE